MDERYWRQRRDKATYDLGMYTMALESAVYTRDEERIRNMILGVNKAQTIREIAAFEIAELAPPPAAREAGDGAGGGED